MVLVFRQFLQLEVFPIGTLHERLKSRLRGTSKYKYSLLAWRVAPQDAGVTNTEATGDSAAQSLSRYKLMPDTSLWAAHTLGSP